MYFGLSIILAFIIAGGVLIITNPQTHVTSTSIPPLTTDKILLPDGVLICSGDCGHPSPYLSATVLANSSSALVTFELFVNGSDEGVTLEQIGGAGSNNSVRMENFPFQFQAYPENSAMPIQGGTTYSVELVATFGDGETSAATVLTKAIQSLTASQASPSSSAAYSFTVNGTIIQLTVPSLAQPGSWARIPWTVEEQLLWLISPRL